VPRPMPLPPPVTRAVLLDSETLVMGKYGMRNEESVSLA
jgi:hypothetical protein